MIYGNKAKEIGQQNYRILKYFFDSKIAIHFKLDTDEWYNGMIYDLNEPKLVMVFDERKKGLVPILLEHIKLGSIVKFKELP